MKVQTWIVKATYRGDRRSTRLAVRVEVQALDAQGALTTARSYFARLPEFEVTSVAESPESIFW